MEEEAELKKISKSLETEILATQRKQAIEEDGRLALLEEVDVHTQAYEQVLAPPCVSVSGCIIFANLFFSFVRFAVFLSSYFPAHLVYSLPLFLFLSPSLFHFISHSIAVLYCIIIF